MRTVAVLALTLGLAVSLRADEADPQAALAAVRAAAEQASEDPQLLVRALESARASATTCGGDSAAARDVCRELLAEARSAATASSKAVRKAGWELATALLGDPGLLQTEDALWLLEEVEAGWSDATAEKLTVALAQSAALLLSDAADPGNRRKALKASGKLLRSKQHALAVATAVALARVPQERARNELARALKKRRDLESTDLVSIVKALGVGGGSSAVAIHTQLIEDASAPVLDECLVALFALTPDELRPHAHDILDLTMKVTEREYRERLALTGKSRLNRRQQSQLDRLAARAKAWSTDRVVDDPPMDLPSGARGVIGVTALWWKLIDVSEGRITPPEAPKDAFPRFLNGRPHIDGRAWFTWWRSAR